MIPGHDAGIDKIVRKFLRLVLYLYNLCAIMNISSLSTG